MKPRKWVFLLGLLTLLCLGGIYLGVRSLERSRNVERVLIEQISPLVGGEFSVDKVRFGFLAVYLSRVQVSIPLRAFVLQVRDIKVGFSFRRLLLTRFDVARSIDKIILIGPRIQLAAQSDSSSLSLPAGSSQQFSLPSDFPVDHLLIRNGVVHVQGHADTANGLIADQIDGRVWESPAGIHLDLDGRFAAHRRNLSATGLLSSSGRDHQLSLRINRARVHTPIRFRTVAVTQGVVDGALELLFTDTLRADDVEATGWLNIRKGAVAIAGAHRPPVEQLHLSANLAGRACTIDSLSALWNDVHFRGRGLWELADPNRRFLKLRADGLDADMLFPAAPPAIRRNLLGKGWASVLLRPQMATGALSISMQGGGISAWGKPVTTLRARGQWANANLTLDSLLLETPSFSFLANGLFDYRRRTPVYLLDASVSVDAETFGEEFEGAITVDGSLGSGRGQPLLNCSINGHTLAFGRVRIGNPRIAISGDPTRLGINSVGGNDSSFAVSGFVEGLFDQQPRFDLSLYVAQQPLMQALGSTGIDVHRHVSEVDFRGTLTGTPDRLNSEGVVEFEGASLAGALGVKLHREPGREGLRWELVDHGLQLADAPFPVLSRGAVYMDSLVVDTLSVLGGVGGAGSLTFGERPSMSFRYDCTRFPLASLDALLFGGGEVFRGGLATASGRIYGPLSSLNARMQLRVREGDIAGIAPLHSDIVVSAAGTSVLVRPFVVRRGSAIILAMDTVAVGKEHFDVSGSFSDVDLAGLVGRIVPESLAVSGSITGSFSASDSGFPVLGTVRSDRIAMGQWGLDSIESRIQMSPDGLRVDTLYARDGPRSKLAVSGFAPWSFILGQERNADTLRAEMEVEGDLVSTLHHNYDSPVDGSGMGRLYSSFWVTADDWHVEEAALVVEEGTLLLKPFVPDPITGLTVHTHLDSAARLHTLIRGTARRQPVSIMSTHDIPDGYESLVLGPIDCGVLQLRTPGKGIDIHLVGLLEPGERGNAEFAGLEPFSDFSVSGPIDRLTITGRIIVRNTEFTFPPLEEETLPWEFDPFPYVNWEVDIEFGNRKVHYFYDVGIKRRMMRFVDVQVEPGVSVLKMRGRDIDKDFRIYGSLRSYKGGVYYGRTFDRNLEVGLDFEPLPLAGGGYDNLPIIWGSVEAFADTSRFGRIKLTLLVKDSLTGGMAEKGRFSDLSFRLSSDFEEMPGESEREFYRAAGLKFVTFEGAGGFVSDFGEQYLHRYLLQRLEKRIARRLGLDVITLETSIASNYFNYLYNNHWDDFANQWNRLALANVGITVGRYFFRDKVFLKWRTELIPVDELILPEHSIGFEFQPSRYMLLEADYGFHKGEVAIEYNPKLRMQLRLPIKGF